MPKLGLGFGGKVNADAKLAAAGRLVVDTEISAKELIRCKSYDLTTLVTTVLKLPADRPRARLDDDEIRGAYQSSANLVKLIEMTLTDANHVLALTFELNVIPLAHQITTICGNTMSKTLSGGRAERNTFLLLHAFNEKGFICPDKEFGSRKKHAAASAPTSKVSANSTMEPEDADATVNASASAKSGAGRKKPQYAGGLVLEPKRGFYDKFVLLLDFNSLYPSIIQEYNICFTTINLKDYVQRQPDEADGDALPPIPDGSLEAGVLPTEIRRLVDSRRTVKNLLKTVEPGSDAYCQYDIRQKALKLTANSMYGCLGFAESRFYAKPLAALVTAKGRESLMKTKELALSMGLDVIYGDTDSIMINTNSTDIEAVFKLGQRVKAEVNKLYKLLEIDIDGIFKSMLLLKKKKYAALTMSKGMNGEWITSEELKGLDIVRRDWSDLATTIGKSAVSEILSGKSREEIVAAIHDSLVALEERVRLDNEPLQSFVIQKQLVKNPEEYPDKKSLPHVQVAMRNNSRGGKKCKAGDTVPYVICLDGSNSSMALRAYHPDDLGKMDNLKVDKSYYMTSQVHPVVSRLCDPIEGLDGAVIAAALGLNPNDYVKRNKEEQTEEEAMMAGDTYQEAMTRFKDCDRFKFSCVCGKEQIWDSVFFDADGKSATPTLTQCGNSECKAGFSSSIGAIKNRLTLDIRGHLKSYYANWLRCEDDACAFRTRRTPLAAIKTGVPRCPQCRAGALHPELAASKLHDQLLFYRFIFDWEKGLLGLNSMEKEAVNRSAGNVIDEYGSLRNHVDKVLADSAYDQVELTQFARMWC